MTVAPDFSTDPFFNLKDHWIITAPNEMTHYHEQGDGVPILLLHGSGVGTSASATWWLNIPSVAKVGHCIAFDFIGYGETQIASMVGAPGQTETAKITNQTGLDGSSAIFSDTSSNTSSDARFGIRAWGKHTLRLMDALGIEKAWLMGSSLGGWVALQLALNYPERILGVISVGTGGAPRDKSKASSRSAHASNKSGKPQLTADYIYQDLQRKMRNDPLISDTLVNLRLNAALKEQQKGLRAELLQARDRDRVQLPLDMAALGQLDIPVLLIHGVDDQVVPMAYSMQLLQAIPTAEAHLFNDSGHWPHIGQADRFNGLVTDYLRRLL